MLELITIIPPSFLPLTHFSIYLLQVYLTLLHMCDAFIKPLHMSIRPSHDTTRYRSHHHTCLQDSRITLRDINKTQYTFIAHLWDFESLELSQTSRYSNLLYLRWVCLYFPSILNSYSATSSQSLFFLPVVMEIRLLTLFVLPRNEGSRSSLLQRILWLWDLWRSQKVDLQPRLRNSKVDWSSSFHQ